MDSGLLGQSGRLRLCVITEAETVRAAVRVCCLPPNELAFFDLGGFLGEDHAISERGEAVLSAAEESSAVLVDWSLDRAPLINLLCYEVRKRAGVRETAIPVIALCSGSPEEVIAARAAGADEAMGFPLYAPLIQAAVVSHGREAEAMRRAETTKLLDKITGTRDDAVFRAGSTADAITSEMLGAVEAELAVVDPDADEARVGDLRLDRKAYRFFVGSSEVELTPKEFELLGYLMANVDAVCSRDEILDSVWGIDFETGTNMVEVYMHFLRKKLTAHSLGGMIQTVRGRGYRLSVQPERKKAV